MGTGGYKTAVPKWEKTEDEMRKKGVTPATNKCHVRSKNWLLGHGGSYDTETGEIIVTKKAITKPKDELVKVIQLRKMESSFPTERTMS